MIEIKDMQTPDEMKGKSYVHYKAWHEAYSGIIDEAYLDGVTLEKCEEITENWPDNVLVAKDGDRVVGFSGYGPYRDDAMPGCGEVYSLYILADYYDKGLGFALMNASIERLSAYKTIALWVLKDNERAIRFYERYGFCFDGAEQEIQLGSSKTECRMVFEKRNYCGNT